MNERARNVTVGLFMVGCIILMGLLVAWFGASPYLFKKGYSVTLYFPASSGIGPNTSITMNGQRIGAIEDVVYRNVNDPAEGVEMRARIDAGFKIPAYAEATIMTPMFMGKSTIGIKASDEMRKAAPSDRHGFLPEDGTARMIGRISQGLLDDAPRLIAKVEAASDQFTSLGQRLEAVADNMRELTLPRTLSAADTPASGPAASQPLANISTAVQRLDQTLKYINMVISKESVRADLEQTIANARQATEDLKAALKQFQTVADNANGAVSDARTHMNQISTRAVAALDSANKLVDELHKAVAEVNNTRGTLGRLLRDPRLYEGLVITTERMRALLAELELRAKEWQNGLPLKLK